MCYNNCSLGTVGERSGTVGEWLIGGRGEVKTRTKGELIYIAI